MRKKKKSNEDGLRHLWDNIKHPTFRITRIPEDKRKGHEEIFEEIIVEKFPKMGKEIDTQVQEAQRATYRINPRRNKSRHMLIKLIRIEHKEYEK